MADTKNNITSVWKVDISNLKAGISEANRQIKLANAEFKAAASSLDFMADSADGIRTKLDQLTKVLDAQESILSAYEKQLELTVKEQGESSKAADDLRIKIANQKAAINDTKKQMQEYNAKLDDAEKGMEDGAKAADDLADGVKDAGKESKTASEGFTVMKGVLADLAASAIKAVIKGFKDMANAAKEAYNAYDEGADNVIKATGATGEAAEELKNSYANVSKTIVGDMGDIGSALGEVNTRYGLTGDELEKLTTQYLKFAEITESDVVSSIDDTQKALATYGKGAESAGGFLDALAKTTQNTGVDTSTLTKGIISNATAFQEMGLSLEQAVAFMGQLETSGANSETVLNGMRKALKNSAKSGKSLNDSLLDLQNAIENGSDGMDGLNAAYDVFGKSGDQIYGAIKNGTLSFKELASAAGDAMGTVDNTFNSTKDATDDFKLAVQGLKADVGKVISDLLAEHGAEISEAIKNLSGFLSELIPKIKDVVGFIVDHWQIIATIGGVIAGVFAAIKVGTAIMTVFNAVMAANPIGLVVLAIGALIAAVGYLITHFEEFKEFFAETWEAIKAIAETVGKAIAAAFTATWEAIKGVWSGVKDFFAGVWDGIKNAFGNVGQWFSNMFINAVDSIKKAFGNIGQWFKGVFEGAKNIIGNIWEAVTEIVKAPVNFLIRGLNKFIDALNKIQIPDWVPGVGGYGLNIPNIKELERGGVLKKGQMGLLEGNGAEAVVPLENNKAWINATAQAMKEALQNEGLVAGASGTAATSQSVVFNQYNTSPKALSRLDIYRNTQNQLNFARGY